MHNWQDKWEYAEPMNVSMEYRNRAGGDTPGEYPVLGAVPECCNAAKIAACCYMLLQSFQLYKTCDERASRTARPRSITDMA